MLKLINLDINDEKERLSPQSPVVSLLRRTAAAWLQCEDKMLPCLGKVSATLVIRRSCHSRDIYHFLVVRW